MVNGKISDIRTEMSSGSKREDTPEWLISKMYKQLKMRTASEFKNYVICKYKLETYLRYLEDNKLV